MRTTAPSAQGLDPAGVVDFINAVEAEASVEPHGLIIHRNGSRVVEGYWSPHSPGQRRLVYSLSKSFTGAALGLQVGEGRLGLDDLVCDHLPDLFTGTSDRARRLTIRHIASMATGHHDETFAEASTIDPEHPVRGFLQIEPDHEPGTWFAYNQPPVLALALVLERLCGERLVDYLRPRLLDPLGIDDLRWARSPLGVDLGFSGVFTDLDAIARLGQLHLDDGCWNGNRVLPAGWVDLASSIQVANPQRDEPDWRQGYGIQLWRSRHGYRGDGAFGQYMVVLPDHHAVIALFSCTDQMQTVLDLMWRHLLPAMGPIPDGSATADPTSDDRALAVRLAELALPTTVERLGGSRAELAETSSFTPEPGGATSHRTITSVDVGTETLRIHEGEQSVELPLAAGWSVRSNPSIATSASHIDADRIVVDMVFLETPHRLELELDLARRTFSTRWPHVPYSGVDTPLTSSMLPD